MTQILRSHQAGDRYSFDFKLCRSADGWAQLDTAQDASYYGVWVHADRREILSFCEGDVTRQIADTDAAFTALVAETVAWHVEHTGKPAYLDPGCDADVIASFTRLGLAPFFHPPAEALSV